jgi:hypothetical protein
MSSMHQPCPITRVARATRPALVYLTELAMAVLQSRDSSQLHVGLLDHFMPKG